MTKGALLDNDVVLKACAYRCHRETLAATTIRNAQPAILGIARFTLRGLVSRKNNLADPAGASQALEVMLEQLDMVNPTESEIALAAELEEQASAKALEFDTGESQLIAILMMRQLPLLITGDKRAIFALAKISPTAVKGRIASLEQLVINLLDHIPGEAIRNNVCVERKLDKALTACFACSSPSLSITDLMGGLDSYIRHLRKETGQLLVVDLRTIIS